MGKMHAEGVTLIELMVTLAVISILLAVGIPAIGNLIATNRMSAAVNDLVSTLHLARSEALKNAESVSVCASTNWASDAPSCDGTDLAAGWIVFVDNVIDNNDVDAGETVVLKHAQLHDGIQLTAPPTVSFSASGSLENPLLGDVDFLFCDKRGNLDTGGGVAAGRWVQISQMGRPRVFSNVDQVDCGS
jgi:prepilin-type N-terminal cleavage/methylation domain-containing protein